MLSGSTHLQPRLAVFLAVVNDNNEKADTRGTFHTVKCRHFELRRPHGQSF